MLRKLLCILCALTLFCPTGVLAECLPGSGGTNGIGCRRTVEEDDLERRLRIERYETEIVREQTERERLRNLQRNYEYQSNIQAINERQAHRNLEINQQNNTIGTVNQAASAIGNIASQAQYLSGHYGGW